MTEAAILQPILSVSNLAVQMNGQTLFEHLNFDLQKGETLAVLGPNGAGKTVLLKTLLGLEQGTGGIQWKKGVRIGYVPQRVPLSRDLPMTVEDFFLLKPLPADQILPALREVGLPAEEIWHRQLGLLSSGQFQKVLVAWALSSQPEVLLVDEPMAGVDFGGEETIYSLLKRSQSQRHLAIIFVTHDLNVIPDLAHQVLCLSGRMHCYGPPKEMLAPKVLHDVFGKEARFFEHAHD